MQPPPPEDATLFTCSTQCGNQRPHASCSLNQNHKIKAKPTVCVNTEADFCWYHQVGEYEK